MEARHESEPKGHCSILIASFKDSRNLEKYLPISLKINPDTEFILKLTPKDTEGIETARRLNNRFDNLKLIIKEDRGLYHALNQGLAECSGKFTLILGSDDFLLVNVNSLIRSMTAEQKNIDIILGRILKRPSMTKSTHQKSMATLPIFENICHQGLLVRTNLLKEHPFKENLRYAADYAQYLQLKKLRLNWAFTKTEITSFCETGMSQKTRIRDKIIGHKENIIALYQANQLFALTYPFNYILKKILKKSYPQKPRTNGC